MHRLALLVVVVACGPRSAAPVERAPAVAPDAAVVATGGVSEDECREVIDHLLAIGMSAERKAEFEGAERDAFMKEAIPDCQQSMTRAQLDCLRRAATAQDVDECSAL